MRSEVDKDTSSENFQGSQECSSQIKCNSNPERKLCPCYNWPPDIRARLVKFTTETWTKISTLSTHPIYYTKCSVPGSPTARLFLTSTGFSIVLNRVWFFFPFTFYPNYRLFQRIFNNKKGVWGWIEKYVGNNSLKNYYRNKEKHKTRKEKIYIQIKITIT